MHLINHDSFCDPRTACSSFKTEVIQVEKEKYDINCVFYMFKIIQYSFIIKYESQFLLLIFNNYLIFIISLLNNN